MSLLDDPQACLALIEKSPTAVTAQDQQAWLSLFAKGAKVEDPVGSRPNIHDGDLQNGALARFYKTFIEGNRIIFRVEQDIVQHGKVLRDLRMEIHMAEQVSVTVPMHLLYELSEEQGELKIQRLAAHWELSPMSKQLLSKGFAGFKVMVNNTFKMINHLGFSGILGFMQARKHVGKKGKAALEELIKQQFTEASVGKILTAGNTVSASLFDQHNHQHLGVVIAKIQASNYSVARADFYKT